MARIAGINIPQNKLVSIGLTYIYGIGDKHSHDICKDLNIPTYVIPDEYHNPANGSDFAINQINAIVKNVLLNENNDFLLNTVEKISYRPSSRTRFKENKEDICDFIYSTPSSYTTMKRIDYLYKHLLGEKED